MFASNLVKVKVCSGFSAVRTVERDWQPWPFLLLFPLWQLKV